jgi:gluconate 2-dehydrogenase gamma chain
MDEKREASTEVSPEASSTDVPLRRRFLAKSIAILPAVGAFLGCDSQVGGSTSTATGSVKGPDSTTPYQPKFFNPDEWRFIQAAVDRLIPSDAEGPGALELDVPVFIDRQMEGSFGHASNWYMQGPFRPDASPLSGYQSALPPRGLYRTGIAALTEYCKKNFFGRDFTQLKPAEQEALLHGMDTHTIKFDTVSAGSFIAVLWQNTKEGYFADPIHGGNKNAGSWKMIGFPGARADYLDWVSQPGKVYPLGTVTIEGKQDAG